jgi:hypothetical protein
MHRTEIDRLLHALRVALTEPPLRPPFDQVAPLLAGLSVRGPGLARELRAQLERVAADPAVSAADQRHIVEKLEAL